MAIQNIDLGVSPNSETGDDARTWAGKTNANFAYLEGLILAYKKIQIGLYFVEKASGNIDLLALEVGDKFEAWLDTDTRYVVGKVIALPFDINDSTKVQLAVNAYI